MPIDKHANHGANDHEEDEPVDTLGLAEKLSKEAAAAYQGLTSGNIFFSKVAGERAFIATLDYRDPVSTSLAEKNVRKLWAPMLHPPLSYRGEEFQYRTADGSNNNILHPDLGKAGLPYAKSVPGKGGMQGARPDPGDLFDLLLARQGNRQSGSGISSMLLYHASIIIHDIFRTNANDKNISDTSSYLDLSPLYGYDNESQQTVRSKNPEKPGFLKPDTFADRRLLLQPPGVCIYLIMYNRFHNYVAEQLLAINENGKFSLPANWKDIQKNDPELFKRILKKQDEDIFQTARLVTCGLYINISIHDYLRVLMGFHSYDTPFVLDPRVPLPQNKDVPETPRATGNMVSVEFNLLYRFHSAISIRDTKWSENFFKLFLKKYMRDITDDEIVDGDVDVANFKALIDSGNNARLTPEEKKDDFEARNAQPFFPEGLETVDMKGAFPRYANVYKFKRDPTTQKFDDQQLVAEMVRVLEDPICEFGAQNVPKIFKAIEVLGILQARKWEVATLNEFRQFFGLPKHKHFEDINADPEIAGNLRSLYGDPDHVELYPGFLCEGDARNLDPGTVGPDGLTPSLWTAVFSDAVTLVRSDRFYTIDWNIASLTTWGMREVSSDPHVQKGSVFARLFQRAFPKYFKYNSLHLWQPFVTPAQNLILATKQKILPSLSLSGFEFDESLKGPLGGVLNPGDKNFKWDLLAKLKYTDLESSGGGPSKIRRKINQVEVDGLKIDTVDKPAELVRIANYEDIAAIISGSKKSDFLYPGLSDTQVIPAGPLQDVLTGTPKGIASIEKLIAILQDEFAKDHGVANKDFFEYFVEVAKEITAFKRKKLQKTKLTAKFFDSEEKNLKKLHQGKDGEHGLSDEVFQELSVKLARVKYLWAKPKKDLTTEEDTELNAAETAEQVYQIDLVKDYAVPIITRFFADYLGFWDHVQTKDHPDREFTEIQIHNHIRNCQDFLSYNADQTTQFKRRNAFRDSLKFLKEQAEHGVHQNSSGWTHWNRNLETKGDNKSVVKMRKLGLNVSRELGKTAKGGEAEVAATMLKVALDVAHTSVLTFTEVIAYFIDPKVEINSDAFDWLAIQNEAFDFDGFESVKTLQRYILEAQRLSLNHLWIRRYSPSSNMNITLRLTNDKNSKVVTLKPGDELLLDLKAAQQSPVKFPNPSTLSLDPTLRPLQNYLGYYTTSPGTPSLDSNQLLLLGLSGLLKYLATLKDLRVAHDKRGRLKKAKDPKGVEGYLTTTWDDLVPFPTTWSLRFTGEGRGVFTGGDNADQGHGMDQVYQKPVFEATSVKIGRLDERITKLEEEIKILTKEKEGLVKSAVVPSPLPAASTTGTAAPKVTGSW